MSAAPTRYAAFVKKGPGGPCTRTSPNAFRPEGDRLALEARAWRVYDADARRTRERHTTAGVGIRPAGRNTGPSVEGRWAKVGRSVRCGATGRTFESLCLCWLSPTGPFIGNTDICARARTYKRTHARAHSGTCTHTHALTYTYTRTHARMHACTNAHTHLHVHTHALALTRTHVHAHARTRTRTHLHAHSRARTLTHLHSHAHTRTLPGSTRQRPHCLAAHAAATNAQGATARAGERGTARG